MSVVSPMAPTSTADRPFGLPADIVLDLPVPPSVNRTRKIDWEGGKSERRWRKVADGFVLAAKCRTHDPVRFDRVSRFELHVAVSEAHTRMDLDNGIKCLIDYLRLIELIENDAPKNLRKLTIVWGHAPEGVRVTVRTCA